MARYTLRASHLVEPDVRLALDIARRRFPEIDVELVEPSDPHVWTCRAPDETHLRRWVAASGIDVEQIIPVGAHDPAHQLDETNTETDMHNTERGQPPCTQ